MPRKGMRIIKILKPNKNSIVRAVRIFSLSIGATAVCMLGALGVLKPSDEAPPTAVEASVFNTGSHFKTTDVSVTSHDTPKKVVPLGTVFGIKLFTDGVIVASLSDVYTENGMCCPAADAGIKAGDYLLEANGKAITSNAALAHIIGESDGNSVTLKIRRGKRAFEAEVMPVFSEGSFKTGIWIRDSAAGIGTLTFYDPETRRFAGLGHGICDMDTSDVMALKSGEPAPITLCGIDKGQPENPGQLKGYFSGDEVLGELTANNETGVYGVLNSTPQGNPIETMSKSAVKCGPVKLLVTVDNSGARLYDAEIEQICGKNRRTQNFTLRVTDPALLELTGGIVQGMSGSPIIQDGKLAGAVTHVFKDDPTCGYGIFIENMLDAAG